MEQSFVAWAKMRARRLPQVKLGIGDDAAVLEDHRGDVVVTTDSLLDGTHFLLGEIEPRLVGKKLVSVNLSDLAAMGAEPEALFLSLCLPRDMPEEIAAEIYEGVCDQCEAYQCALAGGDTNCWAGPLAVHATAIGRATPSGVWTRSGARPEDLIVVTGPLGGSLLGRHLSFEPRIDWVRKVRGSAHIHAAMDISDGLTIDLLRMSNASGIGAVLDVSAIPVSQAAVAMSQNSGKSALEHALGDGEDFELLLAIPPSALPQLQDLVGADQAIVIGTFTSRTGLWSRRGSHIEQLPATGYIHR